MASYYVNMNAQDNGDHEVHKDGCDWMPNDHNKKYLGEFDNCQDALVEALKFDSDADGCYFCCKPCHNS